MTPATDPSPRALAAQARRAAAAWHGAWALAMATGGALLLVVLGAVPALALLALALGAAPGALGVFYQPRTNLGRSAMLGAWAVAGGLAMAITGGLAGPLTVLGLAPLLAAMVYGGLWMEAAGWAFVPLMAVAVIQAGGRTAPTPVNPVALALGLTALATSLGCGAAALMMLVEHRRTPAQATALRQSPDPELLDRLADAEAGRAYAEADAQGKMRFLANMSHELRTPLNAIIGFSDIMRARLFGDLPPKYAEYAELIHESGGHLLELINDVLDISKIDADKYELARETFDAREAAAASLRILRQQADDAGVQLRGVLPVTELDVDADRRALKQIMLNLLSNALKFTPRGGSVTLGMTAAAGLLEITVADTGVGIAPEDLLRLGRPYEQAGDTVDRARGTGLGLSLVKAFARLHGGDMVVESRLGEGTAISVRLPVLLSATGEPITPGRSEPPIAAPA